MAAVSVKRSIEGIRRAGVDSGFFVAGGAPLKNYPDVNYHTYRKIPKVSPGAYIFQRPFLRGLYLEGLICGGKFAFQNRLG